MSRESFDKVDFRGDVTDVKCVGFAHDDHCSYGVSELPYVTGPVVVHDDAHCGFGDAVYIFSEFFTGLFEEVAEEFGDVFRSASERGQCYAYAFDPEEEVLSEFFFLRRVLQGLVLWR